MVLLYCCMFASQARTLVAASYVVFCILCVRRLDSSQCANNIVNCEVESWPSGSLSSAENTKNILQSPKEYISHVLHAIHARARLHSPPTVALDHHHRRVLLCFLLRDDEDTRPRIPCNILATPKIDLIPDNRRHLHCIHRAAAILGRR